MTTLEFYYEDGTANEINIACSDLIMATKIAKNIRQAINKENINKCKFVKVFTEVNHEE